jgi:PEP-CTERM motif
MKKLAGAGIALLAALVTGHAAQATPFDTMNSYGPPTVFNLAGTPATLTIDVLQFSFNLADVGNYVLFASDGTTISETVNVSNPGAGPGQIVVTSYASNPPVLTDTDLALGIGSVGGTPLGLRLDPSAGGAVLGLTIFADAISIEVPEPASLALLGVAMAGLGIVRRRRA